MEIIITSIIILFIFWYICNNILEKALEQYNELNEYTIALVKYRKTIMFDIIALIFFFIFDINFLLWIGIVYYIIISILEGILLVISLITGLDEDIKTKQIDKDLWLIFTSKLLNEISSIIMIFTLSTLLH